MKSGTSREAIVRSNPLGEATASLRRSAIRLTSLQMIEFLVTVGTIAVVIALSIDPLMDAVTKARLVAPLLQLGAARYPVVETVSVDGEGLLLRRGAPERASRSRAEALASGVGLAVTIVSTTPGTQRGAGDLAPKGISGNVQGTNFYVNVPVSSTTEAIQLRQRADGVVIATLADPRLAERNTVVFVPSVDTPGMPATINWLCGAGLPPAGWRAPAITDLALVPSHLLPQVCRPEAP